MSFSSPTGYRLVEIGDDGEWTPDDDGEPIPSGDIVEFPMGKPGRHIAKERFDVVHETELGRRWVLARFDRRTFELEFYCFDEEREVFETLDEAVGGNRDPFLYCPDLDASPQVWSFVRKEPNFDEGPEELVKPSSSVQRRTIFTLRLSEEPTGEEVTT